MYKSWWAKIDYVLIFLVLILVIYGLILIYSASGQDLSPDGEFRRQLSYLALGLLMLIICTAVNYEIFAGFELYTYVFTLIILVAVIFVGQEALGAQRWIRIGFFSFQPSEFAKIFVIISMAVRLSKDDALKLDNLAGTFIYLGLPMVLVMMQPDLGTALVLVAVLFTMLFVRGFNPLYILGLVVAGAGVSPFLLKEYQKQRLSVFLDPYSDPTGAGWNVIQSIVGIGSGKLWGRGLFSGTLTQLQFVPEHSTDFIFAVLGEELGFVGGASLILLYFFLLWKTIHIARQSRDLTGSLIATGISAMFLFHIFINLGMAMGIMPATGIPLPFVSYGGSSLVASLMACGLLLNISLRREQFFKKSQ